MNYALDLYNLLENHALDKKQGGYVEARAENWTHTDDMILSPKDMNCPKSMNTNLFRTLPVVFPDAKAIRAEIGNSLANLVQVMTEKIVQKNAHLGMFFDSDWKLLSDEISFGHDIEASWLLWEAICELNDENLRKKKSRSRLKNGGRNLRARFRQKNGCLENFFKPGENILDKTRVWWNQAESMNGFYNAWQMTGDKKYEEICDKQWAWIQNYQADKKGGDWWSALDENGKPILAEPKGGN